ncbi:unnamed protein product [Rangifer tarandus platyrhynchus]|uniref:Uncharacterized protein n=1 Tax=Rangifer tarandus platyrhynchus TaxID=3082113 RepID=A0ABN8ZHJ4_RANTA|nr:unnamed protein product [Rangifer tarandus platyrhynchus]
MPLGSAGQPGTLVQDARAPFRSHSAVCAPDPSRRRLCPESLAVAPALPGAGEAVGSPGPEVLACNKHPRISAAEFLRPRTGCLSCIHEGQAAYETFSRCAGVHFVCACWPLAPCLWVTRVTPLVGANLQMSAEGRGCAAGARLLVAPLGRGERRPASDDRMAPLGLADRPVDPAQPPLRSLPRSRSLLPGSCFSVAAQPGSQSPLEPVST